MLIKKLSAIAAISGICTLASTGFADETAELKELLLKQQKQLEALQQKVEKQQTVHNEALTHYIKNEIDRALEAKGSSLLSLGSNVENLTIKGDLRVRYENISAGNAGDLDHFRQRFRLGFLWKTNEGWEIGAGITTGHDAGGNRNSSGAKSGTSANDTYSRGSAFNNGDLYLDYAYAKHKWENTSLTIGQHKNPFVSTNLLWDSDVRFVGVTGQWVSPDSGFFATGGAYVVETFDSATAENDDANLLALQLGYEANGVTAALAYYHFDSAATADTIDTNDSREGDDQVKLVSAYLEYAGKTDSFKYKVYGEYTINVGADDSTDSQITGTQESEDQGFVLGAEIGVDKWKFKYAYARFESDSAFSPLTDADFGNAVGTGLGVNNVEGHILGVSYNVTKNFQIGSKLILAEEVEDSGNNASDGELLQIDFLYKF